jgi:ATP-dependent Zn protease
MQRIKNPPMRLKDLAGIDAVKEEINEIVAFLRNPKSFQEIGARAPRVQIF